MMWLRSLITIAVLAFAATPALAETCEVVEIEASVTNSPSVDASLNDLSKKLKKMPFSAFNTFKQSKRESKSMSENVPDSFTAKHGSVDLIIRDIDKPAKKKKRYSLGVGITNDKGVRWVDTKGSIDAGDFLMFARTVSDSSGIIYAVGCK